MTTEVVAPRVPERGVVLDPASWQRLEDDHVTRAERLTAPFRDRRARGATHAVEDFLFTYYPLKPGALARWSPGVGVGLAGAGEHRLAHARWFAEHDGVVALDAVAFRRDRGGAVRFHHRLLGAVTDRPARFDCFGLHEWAMVYGEAAGEHRHALPLRLGEAGTDRVVREHRLQCSHIDAFRFFTDDARPLNSLAPTRETQVDLDQGGCLHVGMDLMKTVVHLGPAVSGDLALATFELAAEIRELDMRASPYDVSSYGLTPVRIEEPAGKAAYVAAQRDLSARAAPIRARLLTVCEAVLAA
ncbi:3-methyladenine DNA glycosylase [Litorihabitans aurantiacus]|uniref:3-methyladenine DNA glycosylase n=1 Tax=Litorihabitans aurantiacus TaxID=1930061 RepID=A0AA37XDR9_9MICO|nr:3-methyladenine DNA glycosylase [Litorihabitans aurantiacus]GMA30797.1 hypothetical protein GCM10025875_07890 [Litorihabitans aurantiacus]